MATQPINLKYKYKYKYMSILTFVALYKSMVRSHLDYCCPVWSPYRKGDIEALEKVQKIDTCIEKPPLQRSLESM